VLFWDFCAAENGSLLATFWDKLWVPSSRVKCRFHETLVTNYHFTLHKIPEECRLIYIVTEA
jgi:hypothetical protein